MPLETSDFPIEVQVAFFMLSLLPDLWDSYSGIYRGKDWSSCQHCFEVYEIEESKVIFFFMKLYENSLVSYRYEEYKHKMKSEESKRNRQGNQVTNVKG